MLVCLLLTSCFLWFVLFSLLSAEVFTDLPLFLSVLFVKLLLFLSVPLVELPLLLPVPLVKLPLFFPVPWRKPLLILFHSNSASTNDSSWSPWLFPFLCCFFVVLPISFIFLYSFVIKFRNEALGSRITFLYKPILYPKLNRVFH